MEKTWASGAVELLNHALSHIELDSAFDNRIAFISIDNSVELTMNAFLSLPHRLHTNAPPSRKEIDEANFSKLIDLTLQCGRERLEGLDVNELEFFHRIRNTLYHRGTGVSVDRANVERYLARAKDLLKRLLDVEFQPDRSLLNRVRSDILRELQTRLRAEETARAAEKARRQRLKPEEREFGRPKKVLTPEEIELGRLLAAKKYGARRIAQDINLRRGVYGLPTKRARALAGVSPKTVMRRLAEVGILVDGKPPGSLKKSSRTD